MHEEMRRGHGGPGHTSATMEEMHAEMSARPFEEDRALRWPRHEACGGHTDERNET